MDIVTLLEQLMAGIFDAEKKYLNNPKDFYTLETSVKSTTDAFAASFLGIILTSMNMSTNKRKDAYKFCRRYSF